MQLLKEPDERALDEVTAASAEMIERIDMLLALHPESDPFRHLMLEQQGALNEALDALCISLRKNGHVPAAGNIELAELSAVAAKAHAAISGEKEVEVMAKSLSKDLAGLDQAVQNAEREIGAQHPATREVRHLHASVHELTQTISRFVAE